MPGNLKPWDAVIIGGGPAGSATAIALAREKKNILLLEKEPAAHHKVCGEFIGPNAARDLTALGIDLPLMGAQEIKKIRLIHGHSLAESELPFPAFSLSRHVLDEQLLQQAIAEGAIIQRGCAVSGLKRDSPEWSIRAGAQSFLADSVFLATGKHNLRHWPRPDGAQNDMIGFKMHYRLSPPERNALSESVEIFLFNGGYAGLEPIENGLANFCLVVKKSLYKACANDWGQFLNRLFDLSPYLKARLKHATPCWQRPLAIFGIPYGFIYQGHEMPGLYRLGDQMAVIPSFCGDGISIALHTARLAVAHENSESYHDQARLELGPNIKNATRILQWGSVPLIQKAIPLACRIYPDLLAMAARLTRSTRA